MQSAIRAKLGAAQDSKATILFHSIGTRDVCHIITSKSPKPVFITAGKETKFYLRAGTGTRELNVPKATEYIPEYW